MLERGETKGENGRVLVIGGNDMFTGAPAFAGMAALRSGCDISVVAAPEKTAWAIASIYPDLITRKVSGDHFTIENAAEMVKFSEKFNVVVIGNGIGQESSTVDFVKEIVSRIPQPKVVDANALRVLQGIGFNNAVLTPHAAEFASLTGEQLPENIEERARMASMYATRDVIILLKGKTDIITDKNNIKYNKTGNSGMTIGGTGDVLAGITAGLIAQGQELFEAASNAAFLSGKIGDYLLKKKGIGFTASDMVELIPTLKAKFLK